MATRFTGFEIAARTGIPVFALLESPIINFLTASGSAGQLTGYAIRAGPRVRLEEPVLRAGGEEDLLPERIAPGDLIRIPPGQRFLSMGQCWKGRGGVDESRGPGERCREKRPRHRDRGRGRATQASDRR